MFHYLMRAGRFFRKGTQPGFDGGQGERFFTMLLRIDVAVRAGEIELGQDMKKKVGCIFREGDGSFSHLDGWALLDDGAG